ncbi:MAG: hypothetical protein O7A06_08330 [Acidobacteria bacterium]|nr:hypothetical protein [Acidobacteriota bacterium]MCZ6752669.1 hypothetical protein [Acidobacteriota bacterium]
MDAAGNVVEESDFYPYGTKRVITSTLDNDYKFTGHERDTESGLDHTLYRKNSSALGRGVFELPMGDLGNLGQRLKENQKEIRKAYGIFPKRPKGVLFASWRRINFGSTLEPVSKMREMT